MGKVEQKELLGQKNHSDVTSHIPNYVIDLVRLKGGLSNGPCFENKKELSTRLFHEVEKCFV